MNPNVLRITETPMLVREQAFDRLHDAIITGHFAPGDRLIERELCEAMGISRTSIREVLRRLEAERLVEVEPRRGPTVARINRKQAVEIYEMRAQLEAKLIERFTKEATDEEIAQLCAIYEEIPRAAEAEDVRELISIMTRFIGHVMQVVDHEIISDILRQLVARISFLRALSMSTPGRINRSIDEIGAIVDAVVRRDPQAVVRYVKIYVNNACEAALKRLNEISAEDC